MGYSPADIIAIVNDLPIQRLNDGRLIFLGGSARLLKQYGWYRGDAFARLLAELIGRKTQQPDLTLGQLHELVCREPARYRDLYTTGTNLTRQCAQVFSYETHPNLRVADAVRISMSIPLYFRAVLLDAATGRVVRQPARGQAVEVLVDGGLLANYPLHLFDHPRYLTSPSADSAARAAGAAFINLETLGLRLDRAEQLALDARPGGRQQLAPYVIHDFNSYVGALYTVALENLNPTRPTDWARTVSINTLGFQPKVRRLSEAQKQQLMDSGRAGVRAFVGR